MPKLSRPRHGSLQFWPRKRIRKALPSVNWTPVSNSNSDKEEGLLGFIAYKVGMASAVVKDNTDKSMTKGKRKTIPVTILEVPNLKIFSVRFYKNGKVIHEKIVSKDKELKKKVKLPKEIKGLDKVEDFDDVRVIAYSLPKQAKLKKTPDMIELGIKASDKFEYAKNLVGKEINLKEILKWDLVDIRGLTKGKGLQGPVRRFGIKLKGHKSEKGRRRPGSIGPWHPAHVTFRVPMAGQLGTFTRIHYNLKIIDFANIKEEGKDINKKSGFRHYGKIDSDYVIVAGSVQGPQKRQLLVTAAMRPNKKQTKKQYEFISLEAGK